MPKKGIKIKRYNQLYRSGRPLSSRILRGVVTIVAICVLGFVGWSSYGPVLDYFSGITASFNQSVNETPPPSEPAPEIPVQPEPIPDPAIKAVYLPMSKLSNAAEQDALFASLAQSGINTVLIDLKDSSGTVLYQSGLESVVRANAQHVTPLDLGALTQTAKAHQLRVIGRISAFRDPLASTFLTDAGVKYTGSTMLWLDNSKEQGGKSWLNPYSKIARNYLKDLAGEAITLGVDEILLDHVTFPVGFGLNLASFGETGGVSRADTLASFVAELEEHVTGQAGVLRVYLPATVLLDTTVQEPYGGDPLASAGHSLVLGVMPALFGDGFASDGFTVEQPLLNPQQTVDVLLKHLAPRLGDRQVAAMVQGYTEPLALTHNKPYTAEDITAQIAALDANGVADSIIYSPNGNYP